MSSDSTMKAIAYTAYGGPEVTKLMDFPTPTPKDDEILVRVTGAGLNPVDAIQRNGVLKVIFPYTFPLIAGNEFSGVVTATGSDATGFSVGDPIITRVDKMDLGAFGQYATIKAKLAARPPAPEKLSLLHAAGLPLAGLTAWQALNKLDVKSGDRLLITAGAGGVGQLAIQLAKLRGANVITTASSAGEAVVRKAGADEVIDYKSTTVEEWAKEHGRFDKIFDCAGPDDATVMAGNIAATKPGGSIVSIAGPVTPRTFEQFPLPGWKSWLVSTLLGWRSRTTINNAKAAGVDYEYMFMYPDGKELQHLSDLVSQDKLHLTIDSTFNYVDYAKAFERLESKRSKGKVILNFEASE